MSTKASSPKTSKTENCDLDAELEDSFPASDPPSHTQPMKDKKKPLREKSGFASNEEIEQLRAEEAED